MLLSNLRLGGRTVDIRVEDGLIIEIGAIGSGDYDGEGRWVSPGLWDHHVHFTQWALHAQRIDLSSVASAVDAAETVGKAIGSSPAGTTATAPVVGGGFRDSLWPDAPSRAVLDAVSGDRPVVLVSLDLHAVWLNSAALAAHGHANHPTGLLQEDDAFAVVGTLGDFTPDTVDAWAHEAAAAAARRGVVGIVDLEMVWNLGDWQRRMANGHDLLRVEFGVYPQHLDRAIAEGLRTGHAITDLLSVGPFKVITDGSLNTRTAYTHADYAEGGHGVLTVPPSELLPLMARASAAGIMPAVHAIGDRANTFALDAFETLGVAGRIEHAQLLLPSDYARFSALGVEASVQPEHAMDDRDVADRLWGDRTRHAYAFRSLLDVGATLLFGSDAPVTALDPWFAISAAVSRSRDGREPWHPEQRITNAEALTAASRTTVTVGQPADLVVTELDPLTADGAQLREMPVAATLLGGRYTYGG